LLIQIIAGEKFIGDVTDTGEQFTASVVDNGEKFIAGVDDTGNIFLRCAAVRLFAAQ
jgi:hypothetical protein